MTLMRRNDVTFTSFRRHVLTRFLINQAQITAFFILKSYVIKISRTELTGIVYQYLQIKLKLHLLLFYPSAWYICEFLLFHIEIEGKCGWITGRAEGYVAPPQIIGGGGGEAGPLAPLFLRLCIRRVIPYFDTTCPLLNTEPDPASVRPGSTLLVLAYAFRFMRYRVNKILAMYNLHDSSM